MRLFKMCILLFLIVKGTLGYSFAFSMDTAICCTNTTLEVLNQSSDDSNSVYDGSDEDEEKGCCDQNCHCVCCIHILTNVNEKERQTISKAEFSDMVSQYNFSYQHLLLKNIWQPPRLS